MNEEGEDQERNRHNVCQDLNERSGRSDIKAKDDKMREDDQQLSDEPDAAVQMNSRAVGPGDAARLGVCSTAASVG